MNNKFSRVDEFNLISSEPYDSLYEYIKTVLISEKGKIKKDDKKKEIIEASWRYGLNMFGLRVTVKFRKLDNDKIEVNFRGGFKDAFDTGGVGSKKANEIIDKVLNGEKSAPPKEDIYIPNRGKSKILAAVLALVLGGIGAHKFYLGNWGVGIIYIIVLVIAPYLPIIISIIESIRLFTLSEKSFDEKYNYVVVKPFASIW